MPEVIDWYLCVPVKDRFKFYSLVFKKFVVDGVNYLEKPDDDFWKSDYFEETYGGLISDDGKTNYEIRDYIVEKKKFDRPHFYHKDNEGIEFVNVPDDSSAICMWNAGIDGIDKKFDHEAYEFLRRFSIDVGIEYNLQFIAHGV